MTEEKETKKEKRWQKPAKMNGGCGWIYGFGFVAATVYYLQQATGFWIGVLGIIKAIFWPALLIYQVFVLLHM